MDNTVEIQIPNTIYQNQKQQQEYSYDNNKIPIDNRYFRGKHTERKVRLDCF